MEVKKLQQILIQLGYPLTKYGADGIFGDETLTAVNAFKKSAKLPQNGIVDTATMLAMIDAVSERLITQAQEKNKSLLSFSSFLIGC